VESGVKYIKRNFMPLRDFRSLSDAYRQLKDWVLQTAGNRTHGTTKQKPLSAFIETEKYLLTALPDVPPELATWAKVKLHGNCHVQLENCYYSAPFLAGAPSAVAYCHRNQCQAIPESEISCRSSPAEKTRRTLHH
jgi:hypothetical protein